MNPTRKYFLKLSLFTLLGVIIQRIWSIASAWQMPMLVILGVLVFLTVIPILGAPVHFVWKQYLKHTTSGMRFFEGSGLAMLIITLYRLLYLVYKGDIILLRYIDINILPPGDYQIWFLGGSAVLLLGLIKPAADVLFAGWMKLAHLIQAVMSRVILTLVYILAVLPVGLAAKLIGKKFLDTRIHTSDATYWIDRGDEPYNPRKYKRHF